MAVLKVGQMHCEMCVGRITKALEAAGVDFTVSLEDKTVTVNGGEDAVKTAVEELDDLGFDEVTRM